MSRNRAIDVEKRGKKEGEKGYPEKDKTIRVAYICITLSGEQYFWVPFVDKHGFFFRLYEFCFKNTAAGFETRPFH